MKINKLWYSKDSNVWTNALDNYWSYIKPSNMALERELDSLDPIIVSRINVSEFYAFLLHKYFKWKYTAPHRYASTTKFLKQYPSGTMSDLGKIKEALFQFDKNDIKNGLKIANKIRGLGPAGASGLLALLFPQYYSTVDQFVVKALSEITDLPQRTLIMRMKPESLSLKDGALLIQIMRDKAKALNTAFNTNFWTPRKVDMVLWTYGR
ncbi:MAG: hypothetical protein ACFFFG_17890 [Candidatus Thorarchaeota archaeon]